MTTLEYVRPSKQERIAKETLSIYVPIAARLGIYTLKSQLEDLCFEFLEPEAYKNIYEQIRHYSKMTKPVIEEIKRTLQKHLIKEGYKNALVEARLKSIYSIYSKLKRKNRYSVDDIYDVFAMRVILNDEVRNGKEYTGHVYSVLGLIHSLWTPLQMRFKDYVAVPKPNGYRSLHTTVVGLGPKTRNQPTEIQIRTKLMHEEAERGVASHWLYEETQGMTAVYGVDVVNPRLARQIDWVKALTSLQEEVLSNDEFIDDLRRDIFNARIFVLTPLGDVRDLPLGATPIDFAYAVHSEIGNHCVMAKVNGSIVPLDFELKNGNVVEIVTRENAEPSQYWLSFVKTSSARNKIKAWFKSHEDPHKSLRAGREILNNHLDQISKPPLGRDAALLKNYRGEKLTLRQREELLRDIGRGVLMPGTVIKNLFPDSELLRSKTKPVSKRVPVKPKVNKNGQPVEIEPELIVAGHTDLAVKLAACCLPKLNDEVVGYITRGRGITVHKKDCKVIRNVQEERFIDVHWRKDNSAPKYAVSLEVVMEDRIGLLSDISNLTSSMGINITGMELQRIPGSSLLFREFEVEVSDYDQLASLIRKLKDIPNVKTVRKLD